MALKTLKQFHLVRYDVSVGGETLLRMESCKACTKLQGHLKMVAEDSGPGGSEAGSNCVNFWNKKTRQNGD